MRRRQQERQPHLVFRPYVLDATALIDFERSQDLRKHLSDPNGSIVVPWQVMKQVTKNCRNPVCVAARKRLPHDPQDAHMGVEACRNRLCTWVRRHPSIVSLATTDESALANTVLQNFTALIDAPDAEAIAMASQREATLVTSERSTKMPEAAGRYDVQWITPDQFLREWPGRRRGR